MNDILWLETGLHLGVFFITVFLSAYALTQDSKDYVKALTAGRGKDGEVEYGLDMFYIVLCLVFYGSSLIVLRTENLGYYIGLYIAIAVWAFFRIINSINFIVDNHVNKAVELVNDMDKNDKDVDITLGGRVTINTWMDIIMAAVSVAFLFLRMKNKRWFT